MNILIDFGKDSEYHFARGLRAYLARVACAVGVGFESCSLDLEAPASGYVALDRALPGRPGHDLALIWDEVHGWSAVVEPAGGGAPEVLAYLGGAEVAGAERGRAVRRPAAGRRPGAAAGVPDGGPPRGARRPAAGHRARRAPAAGEHAGVVTRAGRLGWAASDPTSEGTP